MEYLNICQIVHMRHMTKRMKEKTKQNAYNN